MIRCLLLLLTLTSCVCVDVTQSSCQAEENHNITLEWTFTTNAPTSSESLIVYCELLTNDKPLVLYDLFEGVEVSESQDQQFSGRVQCDRDVLREGRVRLHLSRLRTEDSGRYQCQVFNRGQWVSREYQLKVTAAADQPETQKPTETPGPKSRGSTGLYFAPAAVLAPAASVLLVKLCCSWY